MSGPTIESTAAYVICLATTRKDRCDKNFTSVQQVFPKLERFPAVDGDSVDLTDRSIVHPVTQTHVEFRLGVDPTYITSKGAVGCYQSHVNLWKLCVARNEPIVVVEDDMAFPGTLAANIKAAFATIPPDADFASLMYTPVWTVLDCDASSSDTWCRLRSRDFAGLQVYYITPRGAAALLPAAYPIVAHVDRYIGYIATTAQDGDFKAYAYRKQLLTLFNVIASNADSTIEHQTRVKMLLPESNRDYVVFFIVVLCLLTLPWILLCVQL